MKQEEIESKLHMYRPQPSHYWQEKVLHTLNRVPETVTESKEGRINSNHIFNFLNGTIVNIKLKVGVVIVASVILIGGSMVTVYASDDASPGDFLYPLDIASENIQRMFISDPIAKAEFEIQLMDERVLELQHLSVVGDEVNCASAIGEVNAQRIRLQERLQEMDQLRVQNKLQTQDQLRVLEQLKTQSKINEGTMNQIQLELEQNGNSVTMDSLNQVQIEYSKQISEQISGFEQSTGITVQESEQNAGEDTQIQNQNQTQNGSSITPTSGNSNGTQQQNGGTNQQGKN